MFKALQKWLGAAGLYTPIPLSNADMEVLESDMPQAAWRVRHHFREWLISGRHMNATCVQFYYKQRQGYPTHIAVWSVPAPQD